ncbi:rhombosortase [Pseudidiomarina sp.]|uniref:rhombosortase n=1 Tax=Pseudidiomarina sp. TaxID=2081707 RepID=UPI00299EB643|nr:rhombosortase [Pseudidiomarina sp.]MDX1705507.1 rhombosortase [Pseudidiomarina sp.]
MPQQLQVIICSVLIIIIATWLHFYQAQVPALYDDFDFHRNLIWQEPWRILTAHVLHLNLRHLVLNSIGLIIVTILFLRHFNVRSWLNAVTIIAVGISLWVWLVGFPERFVGLSGIIHGLFLCGILLEWSASRYRWDWTLAIGAVFIISKVAFEAMGLIASTTLLSAGEDVWVMHAGGLLAAVLAWWLHQRRLAALTRAD